MSKRSLGLLFCVVAMAGLSACSHKTKSNVSDNTQQVVMSNLDQAAGSVSASLNQLAAIDKATHPVAKVPFVGLQGQNLDQTIDITWNGPIAPLLQKVAASISYGLQIYGQPPLIPILVNIDTTGQSITARQVISNADLQSGTRASIMIFPAEKVISLRYMGP